MHFIPEKLDDYVVKHSEDEPALLKALTRETYQKILQPRMLSGHYQGRVLSMLSKLIHPKVILELGTFTGYSALCLAEGLDKNGIIHTIDINEELVDFVKSTGDWGICSSPLRGDRDNSAYWKRVWLTEKQFLPEVNKLIFTGQKENFAVDKIDGTPNILVDDKPSNINRWNEAGGIGIRYQANEDDLVEYLFEEITHALL